MAYYRLYFLDDNERIARVERRETYEEILEALSTSIDGQTVDLWHGIEFLKRYVGIERLGPRGPTWDSPR
jgi:hypothetical protein